MRNPIDPAAVSTRPARVALPVRALAICLPGLLAAAQAHAQAPQQQPAPPSSQPAAPQPTPSPAGEPFTPVAQLPATPDDTAPPLDFAGELRAGVEAMTADQAAARTVETAPSVKRAQASSQRAREAASEALVAAWPRLELEARYTRLSERGNFIENQLRGEAEPIEDPDPIQRSVIEALGQFFSDIPPTPLNNYLLEARLVFPLSDLFLQILPRYNAAGHAAEAQEFTAKAEAATVALAAREAFYNYARTRASLLVVRASLEQAEAQRRDVNALVSAGTLARVEQMRADAQVALAQVAVSRAEGAVAIARTAFRSLLHKPGSQDVGIIEDWTKPMPELKETQEDLLAIALRERAELQALRALTRAQDENIRADEAGGLPRLGIGGAFDYANPNQAVDPTATRFQESWQVFASLTWSPSDLASASYRAGQTEAERLQTQADMEAFTDALRREIAQGYEDYLAARAAIEAAETGIKAATESYRVRREQFRAGAAVAIDVIDAEAELRRARLELINSAIDIRIARARLDRAIGRGQGR